MSNLGYLSTFHFLNSSPLALCERASLPNKNEISIIKKRRTPLSSIESGKILTSFDVIAFSISYENDYINAVKILDLSSIPTYSSDRKEMHPLVIAGGIAVILNPEPLAEFVDAFLIGDSPKMLDEFVNVYAKFKGKVKKSSLLKKLSKIKGVYVPSLYGVEYSKDGTVKSFHPEKGTKPHVEAAFAKELVSHPAYSYVTSKDAHFSDMFLIEISRGCKRFCLFCAAAYNYLPYKKLPLEKVKEIAELSGSKKIGLISAAVSDYEEIDELCDHLVASGRKFSVSSFRADSLSDALLSGLKSSGHKTLTIAPEAGSQRMRDIIKKGISEADILTAAKKIADSMILNVKLYYIFGLPFENDDDIRAIVTLTKKVRDVFLSASKKLKRAGSVTVSLSPFIPKANTPFYFKGMESVKELKRKMRIITEGLKKEPNLRLDTVSYKDALLETLLARGSRKLCRLIKLMADGKSLKESAKLSGVDIYYYVKRDIPFDETSPFDVIKVKMKKKLLISEYEKAKHLAETYSTFSSQ